MICKFTFLLLAAVPVSYPRAGAGQDNKTAKIYSLRELRAKGPKTPPPIYGKLLQMPGEEPVLANCYFQNSEAAPIGSNEILEILRTAAGGDAPTFDIYEDSLAVSATAAQHAMIQKILDDLAGAAAPVEIEAAAYLLPYGAAAPRGGIVAGPDVKNLEESLKSSRAAWRGVLGGAPGTLAFGGGASTIPFVASFRGEVAKKSKIVEPWIREVTAGVSLFAEASPLREGSATLVTAVVSMTNFLGFDKFETRSKDLSYLDIPKIAGARLAASVVVPAGATLLLRADDPEIGTILVLLHPRGAERKLSLSAPMPNAFLLANALTTRGGRVLPSPAAGAEIPPAPAIINIVELFKSSAEPPRLFASAGGSLTILGSQSSVDSAVARLRDLENSEFKNTAVELRVVRAADWNGAAAPNATIISTATLAAGAHRSAGVVLGREETTVESYQVLIAEETSIAVPRLRSLFRGIVATARILNIHDNAAAVDLELEYSDFGPRERQVQNAPDLGDHERVARRASYLHKIFELPKTGSVVVGDLGAVGNTNDHLFVVAVAGVL